MERLETGQKHVELLSSLNEDIIAEFGMMDVHAGRCCV